MNTEPQTFGEFCFQQMADLGRGLNAVVQAQKEWVKEQQDRIIDEEEDLS